MPKGEERNDVSFHPKGTIAEEQAAGRQSIAEVERIIREELDGVAIEAVVFEVVTGDKSLIGTIRGGVADLMGIGNYLGDTIFDLIMANHRYREEHPDEE